VAGGVAAGTVGALAVAGFAGALSAAASGIGQELFDAAVLFAAVAMLGWHNIWMSRHGRDLTAAASRLGTAVRSGAQPLWALALAVGLAALREGSETVLFLYGIALSGDGGTAALVLGGAIGIAGGALAGLAIYVGLVRIPVRYLFAVTSWLVLLLAAGMASQAAAFLLQADLLPSFGDNLWDTSFLLSEQSVTGKVLHTLIGYTRNRRDPGHVLSRDDRGDRRRDEALHRRRRDEGGPLTVHPLSRRGGAARRGRAFLLCLGMVLAGAGAALAQSADPALLATPAVMQDLMIQDICVDTAGKVVIGVAPLAAIRAAPRIAICGPASGCLITSTIMPRPMTGTRPTAISGTISFPVDTIAFGPVVEHTFDFGSAKAGASASSMRPPRAAISQSFRRASCRSAPPWIPDAVSTSGSANAMGDCAGARCGIPGLSHSTIRTGRRRCRAKPSPSQCRGQRGAE
jgi:high-affinity iron transporter